MDEVKIGGIYRHYKTKNLYKVLAIAKHTESLESLVVYEAQYENPESKVWCRPYAMFIEEVNVNGEMKKRFVLEQE